MKNLGLAKEKRKYAQGYWFIGYPCVRCNCVTLKNHVAYAEFGMSEKFYDGTLNNRRNNPDEGMGSRHWIRARSCLSPRLVNTRIVIYHEITLIWFRAWRVLISRLFLQPLQLRYIANCISRSSIFGSGGTHLTELASHDNKSNNLLDFPNSNFANPAGSQHDCQYVDLEKFRGVKIHLRT